METKYLINGDVVAVLEKLQSGYLVANMYTGGDNESGPVDYIDDEHPYVVKQLYDEVPVQKKNDRVQELDELIAQKNKELQEINKKVREAGETEKAAIEKWSKYEATKDLDKFLDGKITHYVVDTYGGWEIMKWEDSKSKYSDNHKGLAKYRVLSLFGRQDGQLEWKLGEYNDDSGSKYSVYPCTSREQAYELLCKEVEKRFAAYLDGSNPRAEAAITTANKNNIEIPVEVWQKYAEQKKADWQRILEERKKSVEQAELELEKFKTNN